MKHTLKVVLAGCVVAGFSSAAAPTDWSKLPPAAAKTNVTFAADIEPIFKASCVRCHGAERPKARLRLDTLEGVMKGTKDGLVVKTGDSANSLLVKAVSQLDPEKAMPPKPRGPRGPGGPGGPGGSDGPGGGAAKPPGTAGGPAEGPGPAGQPPRNFGPPAKPLTAEQVGLVRAWIDQGAK